MPSSASAKFVKNAPASDKATTCPIRVRRVTDADLRWWDKYAKPIIQIIEPTRPDANWDWWIITSWDALLASTLRQKPECFSLVTDAPTSGGKTREIVCGLIQLVGRYEYLADHSLSSVYVWYLSTTPVETLQSFFGRKPLPKLLGKILLDVGVTRSFQLGLDGRTGLYADDAGKDQLLDFYTNALNCGMTALPKSDPLPSVLRSRFRPNNGRYCYFTQDSAETFYNKLTPYRT